MGDFNVSQADIPRGEALIHGWQAIVEQCFFVLWGKFSIGDKSVEKNKGRLYNRERY